MTKRNIFLLTLLLVSATLFGQSKGSSVYQFLNFSHSARLSALGGNLISLRENDPTLILYNPSSISPDFHTSLAANFTDYYSTTGYGSMLYSHTFKKAGSFAFGLQCVSYGKFTETDVNGMEQGSFTAGDYALTVGWGRALDSSFSIGASLKMIYSGYESYNSLGIAADVAGSYYNSKKQISLTLLVKNIGSQLKPYTTGNFESIPFDIEFAYSQKLQHLPIRYHITLHDLHKWNLAYVGSKDPLLEQDGITGEYKYPSKASQFFDNFFRHFVFGLEIIPSKYFSLQLAYNHQRHQEMKIPQKKTLAGFSYGFCINIHSIQIGFARAHYATGAVPNYFTFSANIGELHEWSKSNKERKLQRVNQNIEK
ncbi:MAG: type IX secretion system protein PorQ [Bacteroidales bacterium]|nr:type IX secretion system protein PorQ [Bacteroidales bacterium]